VEVRVNAIRQRHFPAADFQDASERTSPGTLPGSSLRGGKGSDWLLVLDGDWIDEVLERTDIADLLSPP
jgi:hypothetical protein